MAGAMVTLSSDRRRWCCCPCGSLVRKTTGKASVASLALTVGLPVGIVISGAPPWEFVAVLALCALVLVRHIDNIKRLIARRELSRQQPMRLLEPLRLGSLEAPNRVMFGPHVTNLGDDDRRFTIAAHRVLRAPEPAAAAASSSPRAPACTTATGRTSGRRWPSRCAAGWQRDRRGLPRPRQRS